MTTKNGRRLDASLARALQARDARDGAAFERAMRNAGEHFQAVVRDERRKIEEQARQLREASKP